MKKLIIFALMLSCFTVSFSQKKKKKNTEPVETKKEYALTTENDTLSYAIGLQNGEQMRSYLLTQRNLEVDQINEFAKGFQEAMYPKEEVNRNYELGLQMGSELREAIKAPLFPGDSTSFVNKEAFILGLLAAMNEEAGKMTSEDAKEYIQTAFETSQQRAYKDAIDAEKAFLSENLKREGVVETPSGLQYKIIRQGTGEIPGENATVSVHYTGTLTDGTKFDSSVDRGTPFEFNTSGGVIEAWLEAAKMMPVGSKWIIYAPSKLAYGERNMGTIPPYSTLIFEIEVLDIVK